MLKARKRATLRPRHNLICITWRAG